MKRSFAVSWEKWKEGPVSRALPVRSGAPEQTYVLMRGSTQHRPFVEYVVSPSADPAH